MKYIGSKNSKYIVKIFEYYIDIPHKTEYQVMEKIKCTYVNWDIYPGP